MRIPRFVKEQLESLRRDDEPLWRVIERLLDELHQKKGGKKSETQNKKNKTDSSLSESSSELWEVWRDAYHQRYGVEYPRNAKVNAQLKTIKERIGQDAVEVIRFYLLSNDAWLLKTKHAIGNLAKNPETWLVRWQTGQHTISDRLAREAEKAATADDEMRVAMEKVDRIFAFLDRGDKK